MHKCLACGHEFEGKFCPQCGKKWIDPNACPKCGAHREEGDKFCRECGARLDGKVNCPKCGALLDATAAFCVECGTRQDEPRGSVKDCSVKNIVALTGLICLLLSALMGLVFTFVAGVSQVSDSGKVLETSMLYEFFGNVYKDLGDAKKLIEKLFGWSFMGEERMFALYFPAVLGTFISAVGILGVVTLSAITAYKAYAKLYKKKDVNVVAPAVATYLVFATMATLLLALAAADSPEGKTVFSAPTLAGIITGGVLLGLGVLLICASNYRAFNGFNAVAGTLSAIVVCAFTAVIIALTCVPAVGITLDLKEFDLDYFTNASFSLFAGMQAMLMVIENDETILKIVIYCTVGGVSGFALAAVSAATLFRKIPAVCKGKNRSNIILCAVAVALAVLYLTFSILSINTIFDAICDLVGDEEIIPDIKKLIEVVYGVPIATLVITVIAFAAEVAGKFIRIKEVVPE